MISEHKYRLFKLTDAEMKVLPDDTATWPRPRLNIFCSWLEKEGPDQFPQHEADATGRNIVRVQR